MHPFDGKAEIELASRHGQRPVIQLPRLCRTATQHLGDGGDIQTTGFGQGQPFRDPLQYAGNTDLIDHLATLSRTMTTDMRDPLPIGGHDWLSRRQIQWIATDHDGQPPLLGSRLPTRNGRIEKTDTELRAAGCQLLGQTSRGGGVVDEEAARRHARQHALRTVHHGAHIVVIADTEHHQIRIVSSLRRCQGQLATKLGHPTLGLGRGSVIDADLMTRLLQVPRHRIPHDTQTDKCQFHPQPPPGSTRSNRLRH